jgi:hypothetical protein
LGQQEREPEQSKSILPKKSQYDADIMASFSWHKKYIKKSKKNSGIFGISQKTQIAK